MSKPPAKRKRSAADDDENLIANLNLSDSKTTPKVVATALLALLPENATKQHSDAKKLAKAFPLVIAELENRSNKLARKNQAEGTRLPIEFRFTSGNDAGVPGSNESIINLPEECFVNMLKFLNGRDLVKASYVSKVWLSASRLPTLWEGLDMSRLNLDKGLNMTSLLKVLGRIF